MHCIHNIPTQFNLQYFENKQNIFLQVYQEKRHNADCPSLFKNCNSHLIAQNIRQVWRAALSLKWKWFRFKSDILFFLIIKLPI